MEVYENDDFIAIWLAPAKKLLLTNGTFSVFSRETEAKLHCPKPTGVSNNMYISIAQFIKKLLSVAQEKRPTVKMLYKIINIQ